MWLLNPYIAFPPSGLVLPNIGDPFQGGYYAGLISHTADGVATHALIVAPAATGATGTGYTLTTNLGWKTTQTATQDTSSPFDGAANTAAMAAAGIVSHPAANFCVGLSIGGFSDWYLPARYELDVAYKNLKPSTTQNITTFGVNPYSVPPRTDNHTAGDPAQTSLAGFQTGGAEAFAAGIHWTSTEIDTAGAYRIDFATGNQGNLTTGNVKTTVYRVRAFRRVAL